MSDQHIPSSQLQQIPVYALKNTLIDLSNDPTFAVKLNERFKDILQIEPRKLESAIRNCTRTQLVHLFRACPEIRPSDVAQLFREYRYGRSPSFYIFEFEKSPHDNVNDLDSIKIYCEQIFANHELGLANRPTFKGLELIEMLHMPDQTGIVESNFRFLRRLDYVDSDEEAICTYETVYGFFWINYVDGYATIHAAAKEIREVVRIAIEEVTGRTLNALVLPKELQKRIPFLGEDSMTLGRLYNSDPNSANFTSVTIKDDNLIGKGYQTLEDAYTNVRQAHYKDEVAINKKSTIVVSEKGSLRVYGKLTADQFRSWCLRRLPGITNTLHQYRKQMGTIIENTNFLDVTELDEFTEDQRVHLLRFMAILAAFKRFPGITHYPIGASVLEVATCFRDMVYVRLPFSCENITCGEEGSLACPTCESPRLTMAFQHDWIVGCPNHTQNPLCQTFPLQGTCEQLHHYKIDLSEAENSLEIFFQTKLLRTMSDVVNRNIDDCEVNFDREFIFLSGPNVVYHPKKSKILKDGGDTYQVNVTNSKIVAVGPGASASYNE